MLLLTTGAWAAGTVNITQLFDGEVNADVGKVTYEVADGICTLTVTPVKGYGVTAGDISVVKTIDSDFAQSRGTAPAYGDTISVVAVDASADPRGVTVYTFQMPSEEYDVEVKVNFQVYIIKYDLWVNNIQVTDINQYNVLNKERTSVTFDGEHTLFLRDALLQNPIKCGIDSLCIVLMGESWLECESENDTPIQGVAEGRAPALVLTTYPDQPGSMTIVNMHGNFIGGFRNISLDNYLAIDTVSENMVRISYQIPIKPVIDDNGEGVPETAVDINKGNFQDPSGVAIDLSNTEVDNVLYTVPPTAGGFEPGDASTGDPDGIVLRVSLDDEELEDLDDFDPGSEEYAEAFKGITLMAPAGEGHIVIVAKTFYDTVLKVKIGEEPALSFSNVDFSEPISVPFSCAVPTLVRIYHGGTQGAASRQTPFREKVETVHVKVTSIGATASSLITEPNIDNAVVSGDITNSVKVYQLSVDNFASDRRGLVFSTICGYPITEFMDGLFDDVDNKDSITYIDLSNTGIHGLNYSMEPSRSLVKRKASRLAGMIDGFGEHTLIFLPDLNDDGGESNIVINGVCRKLRLFESAMFYTPYDFIAEEVILDRQFTPGQPSTLFMPFELSNLQAETLGTFHTFKSINGDKAVFNDTEDGDIQANTAYLFVPDVETVTVSDVDVTKTDNNQTSPGGNGLKGTYEPINWIDDATTVYEFVAGNDNEDGSIGHFRPIKAGVRTLSTHACLITDYAYPMLRVFIDKIDVTQVSAMKATTPRDGDEPVYDLSGRAVNSQKLTKGIYVYKGKKIIVR